MLNQMNREIFSRNLECTVREVVERKVDKSNCLFEIQPVLEPNKPLLWEDDFMRLNVINPKIVCDKLFTWEETITMLTIFLPCPPIRINTSFLYHLKSHYVFKLECSLRIRKPSLLRNQETGHPPFKAVF